MVAGLGEGNQTQSISESASLNESRQRMICGHRPRPVLPAPSAIQKKLRRRKRTVTGWAMIQIKRQSEPRTRKRSSSTHRMIPTAKKTKKERRRAARKSQAVIVRVMAVIVMSRREESENQRVARGDATRRAPKAGAKRNQNPKGARGRRNM